LKSGTLISRFRIKFATSGSKTSILSPPNSEKSRIIDNKIKSPLSRRILFGDLKDGGRITVSIENEELDFTISEMPKVLTKEEKKALKKAKAEQETIENVDEDQTNNS
jgi:GGDEF domain-containing protein